MKNVHPKGIMLFGALWTFYCGMYYSQIIGVRKLIFFFLALKLTDNFYLHISQKATQSIHKYPWYIIFPELRIFCLHSACNNLITE